MRLFVGVPINQEITTNVGVAVYGLQRTGARLRFVPPGNLHFTLKFLGDVSNVNEIVDALREISKKHKPFDVSLQGIGAFPNWQKISVIWVGCDSSKMVSLMQDVQQSLEHVREEEHETITPHLTIARVPKYVQTKEFVDVLEKIKNDEFGSMKVEKIVLYKSAPTRRGPIYSVVEEFNLET